MPKDSYLCENRLRNYILEIWYRDDHNKLKLFRGYYIECRLSIAYKRLLKALDLNNSRWIRSIPFTGFMVSIYDVWPHVRDSIMTAKLYKGVNNIDKDADTRNLAIGYEIPLQIGALFELTDKEAL